MTCTAHAVDVAVIGGGVAGLVAARRAVRDGKRVAVLEAAPSLGGLVGCHDVGGIHLDSGAEAFATRGGHVAALAAEHGLTVVTPDPAPAHVLHEGRLSALPATGVLGIPTDLEAPGLAEVLGPAGLARARQDAQLPMRPADTTTAQPTLAELVTSRMGPAVLEVLVRPIVRGVHSNEPEQLSAEALLPGITGRLHETGSLAAALAVHRAAAPAGSAVAGIDGGVHWLPVALAADIAARGGKVRTDAPVRSLRVERSGGVSGNYPSVPGPADQRVPNDGGSARWHLAGQGWQLRAEQVILACPPHSWGFLRGAALEPLRAVGRSWPGPRPADLVTLVLRAGLLPAHEAAGTLVAEPGQGAKALTYSSSKWHWVARTAGPDRAVVRLSYPPGVLPDHQPSATEALTLRDAARLTGALSPWPADALIDSRRIGLSQPVPATQHQRARLGDALDSLPGLYPAGAWWAGTGLAAVVAHAEYASNPHLPHG